MKFKGKAVRVVLVGDARAEFEELNRIVGEEWSKGIRGSRYQTLFSSLKQKIELLKVDPMAGIHIPKNQIPSKYAKLYGVNNLWKMDLSSYWRFIYTIKGSEVDIISIVLDIIDHRRDDRIFGYRKR